MASRSVICQSRRLRQIIDLRDTDKSWYFAITEFNNCFINQSPFFWSTTVNMPNHSLPAQGTIHHFHTHKNVVSIMHEQNVICSKALIYWQLIAGQVVSSRPMKRKGRKEKIHQMIIITILTDLSVPVQWLPWVPSTVTNYWSTLSQFPSLSFLAKLTCPLNIPCHRVHWNFQHYTSVEVNDTLAKINLQCKNKILSSNPLSKFLNTPEKWFSQIQYCFINFPSVCLSLWVTLHTSYIEER